MAGPSVLGFLCITVGGPGWLLLGGLFLVTSIAVRYAVAWAERDRPAYAEEERI